ncbi:PREDICTED: CO(2)-response secreted protease isoform X1 [Theobroma cacao]|uniref:CO(2)-response secreted protease isoform X1 n=1 Tax=Theobroma cacao TaxID=3641 RepID=A0AB32UUV0_THECC|nr:PREDICTED: CO(2)-response secreted protease isoform X1 [Theobroma cacao]
MNALITFIFSLSFFSAVSLLTETGAAAAEKDGVYIVYMGAAASRKGSLKDDHAQLLSSLLKRKTNALVHNYKHGFSGFAAVLSAEEAHSIAERPGVVSVFPDSVIELHTTRSWDFLKYQTSVVIDSNPNSDSNSTSDPDSGAIIGVLDTGIWPESESFNDKDMGPIPPGWHGTCAQAQDFNTSNCNRKIIGARSYEADDSSVIKYHSPRDTIGHGTHVASTAAGSEVQGVSYYGLAEGTAKGGSPGSRLAIYRVCSSHNGCRGSSILAAFDDAIADGVDVLSLSLGAPSFFKPELIDDPIAIGAFHAVQHNITVVCSAGNDGPTRGSVVNAAPWILTVAASTIDRDFESDVVLGEDKVIIKVMIFFDPFSCILLVLVFVIYLLTDIQGEGINFANIQKSPVYPIIYAQSANKTGVDENESRSCNPDSMDQEIIKGKIVVCDKDGPYSPSEKKDVVKNLGGIGVVLIDDESRAVASTFGTFPATVISSKDGAKVLSYINSTKNPAATILPTTSPTNYKPAPTIAYFSSRGPSTIPKNILKPDIAAPGVNILAAWLGNDTAEAPEGKDPPLYNVISGTSMACPHVSGIAATVKSRNSKWSPSAIRSAIMTTATQTNNLKAPITTDKGAAATPYDFGAGEVSTTGPLQPGLVYETTTIDYLNFLCYYGYNISTIKIITNTIPDGFTCPEESSIDLISNINYPSIAISNFNEKAGRKVNRTLTNVAEDDKTVYTVSIDAPAGLDVQVVPDKLQFTNNGQKSSYQVSFSSANPLKEDVFGFLTWSNEKYKVRSPFAVSSESGN